MPDATTTKNHFFAQTRSLGSAAFIAKRRKNNELDELTNYRQRENLYIVSQNQKFVNSFNSLLRRLRPFSLRCPLSLSAPPK